MNRARLTAIGVVLPLLVVALLFWRWMDRRNAEDMGKWQAIAKRLQADSARAANAIRRTDSVFFADTITLTRTRDRFVRVVDSIRTTDTLTVRESVLVATADTALRACQAVVTSCVARVAARDSLIATLGQQRTADRRLFDARLRRANPFLQPYGEALVDPLDTRTMTFRGGLTMRLLGPIRLSTALQHTTTGPHPTRALVGARIVF